MSIIIYTDGSSRGNPGPGGWGVVIVSGTSVRELGGRSDMTTNNRMEMTAALEALRATTGAVTLHTDSMYLINGVTRWVSGWKKNDWKTATKKDVENKDLWQGLDEAVSGRHITWEKVAGHAGVAGNERCDDIATGFADDIAPHLYVGPLSSYPVDLTATASVKKPSKKSSSAKAYSYLSLVAGVLQKHATWAECEARVKGVKGARFKKAFSPSDEEMIAHEWGIN